MFYPQTPMSLAVPKIFRKSYQNFFFEISPKNQFAVFDLKKKLITFLTPNFDPNFFFTVYTPKKFFPQKKQSAVFDLKKKLLTFFAPNLPPKKIFLQIYPPKKIFARKSTPKKFFCPQNAKRGTPYSTFQNPPVSPAIPPVTPPPRYGRI